MNPLELMELHKVEFTKKELEVYELITNNYDSISGSTATVFANRFGISQSVLSRFCKKLGYSGYGELRMAMYQSPDSSNESDRNPTLQIEKTARLIGELSQTVASSLEQETIDSLAKRVIAARFIYTIGQGMSMTSATALTIQLLIQSLPTSFLNAGLEAEALHCMNDKDLVFIFSDKNPTFQNFFETVRELPANSKPHLILITLSPRHPHAQMADEVIVLPRLPSKNSSIGIGSLYSMLFFGTYLAQAVSAQRAQLVQESKHKEKGIFHEN